MENNRNIYIDNFDSILEFFENRPKYALAHIKEYLKLSGELKELTILKEGKGKVKINTIIPEFIEGKWVGKYFTDIPIRLTAIPSEKCIFKGWNEDVESNSSTILIKLNEISIIKANFENLS